MVTIRPSNETIEISSKTFSYEDFYESFHKCLSNSNDYEFTFNSYKMHKIGESDYCLGLVPQPEAKKYDSLDSDSLVLNFFDFSNKYTVKFITGREVYYLIAKSEVYDTGGLLEGEVIEYPTTWERKEDKIILNETFSIECDTASYAIESLLKDAFDNEIAKFRFGDYGGERWCFEYSEKNPPEECIYCDNHKESIFISKPNRKMSLPCSTICLGCLSEFASNYLNFDREEITSLIVSSHI